MKQNRRIVIVDALRGFALLLIVLIHYVEHFDFFRPPEINFLFSSATDQAILDGVFFFISGKAYSIFALLFGFSFFIQLSRKEAKGIDFRGRFTWRLILLLIMGFFHSLIYKGDILHIYALLGFVLVFFYHVNNRVLYLVSFLLVLQIPMIVQLFQAFTDPSYAFHQPFGNFWEEANETYATGTFWEVLQFNLWKGRATVWGWTIHNGRYLQLLALFIVGLILGRKRIFEQLERYHQHIRYTFFGSIAVVALFYALLEMIGNSALTDTQIQVIQSILGSYNNLFFTTALCTAVMLLYLRYSDWFGFSLLATYGKMSLTNYVGQAVFGVILFYGFGFGLYRYLGSTWSILLGALVFGGQLVLSHYWSKHFYYGPLEWLWRSLTFFDFKTQVRKGLSVK